MKERAVVSVLLLARKAIYIHIYIKTSIRMYKDHPFADLQRRYYLKRYRALKQRYEKQ